MAYDFCASITYLILERRQCRCFKLRVDARKRLNWAFLQFALKIPRPVVENKIATKEKPWIKDQSGMDIFLAGQLLNPYLSQRRQQMDMMMAVDIGDSNPFALKYCNLTAKFCTYGVKQLCRLFVEVGV